jgi:phage-related tail fiber protein
MEHINYRRAADSAFVVTAASHATAAFFKSGHTGYNNYGDALRYAAWLRGINHCPVIYTIAEYDAARAMGAL